MIGRGYEQGVGVCTSHGRGTQNGKKLKRFGLCVVCKSGYPDGPAVDMMLLKLVALENITRE